MVRIGILTVSARAARGEYSDLGGTGPSPRDCTRWRPRR